MHRVFTFMGVITTLVTQGVLVVAPIENFGGLLEDEWK